MLLSLRELGLYLLIYSKLIAPLTPLDGLFLCHDFFKLIFTGVFPWLLIRWFLLDYNFLYYLPTFFPSIHNIYWPFTSSRVLKGHSSIIYEAHIMCYGRFARRSHSRSEKAEVIFGSLWMNCIQFRGEERSMYWKSLMKRPLAWFNFYLLVL